MSKQTVPTETFIKIMGSLNLMYIIFCVVITHNTLYFWVSVTIGLILSLIINIFFVIVNYWPHLIFKHQTPKTKPAEIKNNNATQVITPQSTPVPVIRELSNRSNNPFLLSANIGGETITVDGKESVLYKWSDYKFNLETVPHTLILGSTGSGKSSSLNCLITQINNRYNNPHVIICDAGNFDFPEAVASEINDIIKVMNSLYIVMRGRQVSRERNATRIIWLLEEAEAFLANLGNQGKDIEKAAFTVLGDLGRLARKTNVNMIFVSQKGKADIFPTTVRDNFGNRVIMRSPNNLSNSFDCSYNTSSLPVGIAYNNTLDAFVKFDYMENHPPMNLLQLSDLHRLERFYRRKYNIISPLDVQLNLEN